MAVFVNYEQVAGLEVNGAVVLTMFSPLLGKGFPLLQHYCPQFYRYRTNLCIKLPQVVGYFT